MKIVRKQDGYLSRRKFKIFVNGAFIQSIHNNEILDLDINDDEFDLQIFYSYFTKSRVIRICKSNDTISCGVNDKLWSMWNFWYSHVLAAGIIWGLLSGILSLFVEFRYDMIFFAYILYPIIIHLIYHKDSIKIDIEQNF